MSHHEIVDPGDGTREVHDPNGNVIASGLNPPVSSVDDVVLDAVLDDVGLTDTATRDAIKAIARGVEVQR